MRIVAATPYEAFAGRVRRLLPEGATCEHVWRERLLVTELPSLAHDIARVEPCVVLIGPGIYDEAALELAAAVDRARPDVVIVLMSEPSAELWPAAARAGVRDIVAPDGPDDEFTAALARALEAGELRRAALAEAVTPPGPGPRVLTVFSPKGGAGKTTLATNLAVGLAEQAPGEVVLVDLDLQFGGVPSALQLAAEHSIADAASVGEHLDAATLKVFLAPHASGLFVLAAPDSLARVDDVTPETVERVLRLLSTYFRYVVIDTAAGIDVVTVAAIENCTDLVLISTTDVACVRALRRATDALDTVGIRVPNRHFVFNRSDVKGGLGPNDLRSVTGATEEVLVPEARAVAVAMNAGVPIIQSDPRSPAAKSMFRLVERFLGGDTGGTRVSNREVA